VGVFIPALLLLAAALLWLWLEERARDKRRRAALAIAERLMRRPVSGENGVRAIYRKCAEPKTGVRARFPGVDAYAAGARRCGAMLDA
jgi:hypothetical protein